MEWRVGGDCPTAPQKEPLPNFEDLAITRLLNRRHGHLDLFSFAFLLHPFELQALALLLLLLLPFLH
jgi:hypothetical protein